MIMHNKVYIQNQTAWGESKIAERQRKRERERGRASLKMRDDLANKFDFCRKYLW